MCGFVTIVTGAGNAVSARVLERMTETLAHRGPDDFGYAWVSSLDGTCKTWTGESVGGNGMSGILFGHRRLSILDLSMAGHQPFLNADRSMVLSYNGEIYNFVELREELTACGASFRSRSDTEVLLAAYEQWGVEAFSRFNGMWAFTLWDARKRKLIASRDRFGIKPLYYTEVDGNWIFASEIKAVLEYPGARRGFSETKVLEFLARALVDHSDETLFSKIQSVPPAGYLELREGRVTHRRFWKLELNLNDSRQSEGDLIDTFRDLLGDSVRIRMRSDVPIGTMLSGGLDSTSITALIDQQRRLSNSTNSQPAMEGMRNFHHTFTACWPEARDLDEEARASLLCTDLGLSSHKLYPTAVTVGEILPRVTHFLEEPFETPIAAVHYLLMQEARRKGVKVVLNGHGSDETLAGYPDFLVPPFLAQLLLALRLSTYRRERRAFSATRQWSTTRFVMELLRALTPAFLRGHLVDLLKQKQEQRLGIFQRPGLLIHSHSDQAAQESLRRLAPLNAALWRAFSQRTIPQWLRMEDRVSMAHSVESRLPFMDYRLVEFAFRLPDTMKLRDGYTKYILRQAMKHELPSCITSDRQKRRFAAPFAQWFRGAWRPMIQDMLLTGTCNLQPYLELSTFRKKLEAYLLGDNQALNAMTLWRILHAEIWMRAFS